MICVASLSEWQGQHSWGCVWPRSKDRSHDQRKLPILAPLGERVDNCDNYRVDATQRPVVLSSTPRYFMLLMSHHRSTLLDSTCHWLVGTTHTHTHYPPLAHIIYICNYPPQSSLSWLLKAILALIRESSFPIAFGRSESIRIKQLCSKCN